MHAGETSIRRFRKRHSLNIPGTEPSYTRINGDQAECMCPPEEIHFEGADQPVRPILADPDTMLRQRGLDPEEWYIDSITVNEWDGLQKGGVNKTKLYQTKFTAKRKRPELILQPVRSDGWKRPPRPALRPLSDATDTQLVVICGDAQAPHHDESLHNLFCQWLEFNEPERGVDLGDLIDFSDISRHPPDPENVAHAQEGLQAGYDILRDRVDASPGTDWELIPGNHDERIRQYLLNHAPYLYGITRVDRGDGSEPEVAMGLSHLLRLDELGIKYIEPYGTYEDAQVELSKYLAVRHGWIVRQGSGTSALKTLEQTGYSILVGHTHRQSIVQHTVHDIDRKPKTLLAAEIGCLCRMDSGRDPQNRRFPAYSVLPDWQQGFATATLWSDGRFKIDLATYFNDTLLWRDQRYSL